MKPYLMIYECMTYDSEISQVLVYWVVQRRQIHEFIRSQRHHQSEGWVFSNNNLFKLQIVIIYSNYILFNWRYFFEIYIDMWIHQNIAVNVTLLNSMSSVIETPQDI